MMVFKACFFYQPTFDTLELKEYKPTEYVISWKSKGICASKLVPLYTAFSYNIKPFGYKIRI